MARTGEARAAMARIVMARIFMAGVVMAGIGVLMALCAFAAVSVRSSRRITGGRPVVGVGALTVMQAVMKAVMGAVGGVRRR